MAAEVAARRLSSVIARATGPKQSHENKEGLLRGVYPESSRRARSDTGEGRMTLGVASRGGGTGWARLIQREKVAHF